MAATGAVMTLLKSGDHVVVTDNTYGGTYRLFEQVLRKYQLDFTYVDTSQLGEIERGDPADDEAAVPRDAHQPGAAAHRPRGGVHDRARPRRSGGRGQHLCQPVRAAAARVRRRPRGPQHDEVPERPQRQRRRRRWSPCATTTSSGCRFVQNAEGAILGPMDAWLVLRGTKTLPIRMERHNANAHALAEYPGRRIRR